MAYILTESSTGLCAHGAKAAPIVGVPRVKIGGSAVLTVASQLTVSACPNVVATSPFPCAVVMFAAGATRVKVMGQPVLLDSSSPTTIPTSTPTTLVAGQAHVKGQ